MDLYHIDYDKVAEHLTPPDKRLPKFLLFVRAMLGAMKYHSNAFNHYRNGMPYPVYDETAHYQKGDGVVLLQNAWISTSNNNQDNYPGTDANWVLEGDATGTNERSRYNGQKLLLEYALNKRYNTTFSQPPAVSAIYITNNAIENLGFAIGATESNSGAYYRDHSVGGIVNETYITGSTQFTIHIPQSLYSSYLGSNVADIKNFVNALIPAGLNYTIVTYQ